MEQRSWRYVEIRPRSGALGGFHPAASYYLHRMDLQPTLNDIFRHLDKSSAQRRIRRAERAGLIEKCGRSPELLGAFYRLLVLTRRRHHIPPQPYVWFHNLLDLLGDSAEIRVAYTQDRTPIAAIFNLRFKDTLVYKYGCSDKRFNSLGATPLLFWRAIENAKATGAREFDLGRSDEDNPGLVAFKDSWTNNSVRLVYWRFPPARSVHGSRQGWAMRSAQRLLPHLPNRVLTTVGKFAYRHIG
jgi:lipid II:glycine glycyltransferase (peptidoglycan interpeptide bridge formation enzyme)